MKKIHSTIYILFFLFFSVEATSQYYINANLAEARNQKIQLLGFEGFQVYLIDETQIDQNGDFKLQYAKEDYGMGYLNLSENENHVLVLAKEDIALKGKKLSEKETIIFTEGNENILFSKYSKEFPINQSILGAWEYLLENYTTTPHLKIKKNTLKAIENEISELKEADQKLVENTAKDAYIRWFIPIRKMVSEVSYVAQHQPELIPQYIQSFRNVQHDSDLFYKSGLYKDAFEAHF